MASLNVESLRRKFQALNSTQDSVQTLSLWIIHHRTNCKEIIQLWMEQLKSAKPPMRLTLLYLANDILQNSKRKGTTVFTENFKEVLQEAATFCRDEAIKKNVLRIFKIWEERSVFTEDFCEKLQSASSTVPKKKIKPKPKPDFKLLAEFKHEEVPEVVEQLARFEEEVELKFRQLGMLNVDVASTETIMQLKDRAGGKRFSQQFEDSAIKLEDYVASLTKEVDLRRKVFDLLQKSEVFYDAQFGEAQIVANAYKNFGMRVSTLKKRLEEHKALLPDPLSSIPSPSIDAPSPGATPPRDPNSDTIEVEDMELSDEEEDRRRGSIVAAPTLSQRRTRLSQLRSKKACTPAAVSVGNTSTTSSISHISTITGAGTRSSYNQSLTDYSPFANHYTPPVIGFNAIPTTNSINKPAPNSSSMDKSPGGENYSTIKNRLLEVMLDAPKLPLSVSLFDSPIRKTAVETPSKSEPLITPVPIQFYTPSSKAFSQQVSPISTVPMPVPAPVSPKPSASPSDEYDPFESDYSSLTTPKQSSYYSPLGAQPIPPVRQQPESPLLEDDVYDPEMIDYLLETPLEKQAKPKTPSCVIPLVGDFQSPSRPDVQKKAPITPPVRGTPKSSAVGKPGGTPLRDECSTPTSQEESPMLKAATSNPIEFLTKIITSSRQSSGGTAPSTSFLSSLSMLTQTVQQSAQKTEMTEMTEEPKNQESQQSAAEQMKQTQKQNNTSKNTKTNIPFAIGDLVSSFKAKSKQVTPAALSLAPPPKSSSVISTVYKKPNKVPLCQIMNTPAPSTPTVIPKASTIAAVPMESSQIPPSAAAGDSSNSLMARLMHHKSIPKQSPFVGQPTPMTADYQPPPPLQPNISSIILEPPPPPPLPPEETMEAHTTQPPPPPPAEQFDYTPRTSVASVTVQYQRGPPRPLSTMEEFQYNPSAEPHFNIGQSFPPHSKSPTPSSNTTPITLSPPQPNVPPPLQDISLPPRNVSPTPQNVSPSPQNVSPSPQNVPPFLQTAPPPPQNVPPPTPPDVPPPQTEHPPPVSSSPPPYITSPTQPTSAASPVGTLHRQPWSSGPPPPIRFPLGVTPIFSSNPSTPVSMVPIHRDPVPRIPPPPPPGPPPPNAKRLDQRTKSLGDEIEPTTQEQQSGAPVSAHTNLSPSSSPVLSPEDTSLSRHLDTSNNDSQPTSPIPVLGAACVKSPQPQREQSISVLGQTKSAKDMWDQPRVITSRTYESRQVESAEFPHSRPIETLDRKRPAALLKPFRRDSYPDPEQHTLEPLTRDRYEPKLSRIEIAERELLLRDREGRYDNHDERQHYREHRSGLDPHGRLHDMGRSREPQYGYGPGRDLADRNRELIRRPSSELHDYRSTQQLIEEELSALGGDVAPRGAPISTVGGWPEGQRRLRNYSPPRRQEPHYWGGANNWHGPPRPSLRGRPPPPHYRY